MTEVVGSDTVVDPRTMAEIMVSSRYRKFPHEKVSDSLIMLRNATTTSTTMLATKGFS